MTSVSGLPSNGANSRLGREVSIRQNLGLGFDLVWTVVDAMTGTLGSKSSLERELVDWEKLRQIWDSGFRWILDFVPACARDGVACDGSEERITFARC